MAILVAILFISSYTIYSNFSIRFQQRVDRVRPTGFAFPGQPEKPGGIDGLSPEEVRKDLIRTLLLVNGLLLVGAGGLSYALAGITLEPIQRTYDRQRRFLSDASHELRTPLAIMQTDLENELDNPRTKGGARAQAESHLEEVGRMASLVTDLLVLSRLDEQANFALQEPYDVRMAIKDVASRLKSVADQNNVEVKLEAAPKSEVMVRAERQLVSQSFANILKNAIIHNDKGGEVRVVLSVDKAKATLKVTDDGPGIPRRDLDRVFDRFYRSDASRSRQTGGSGLGLSIVRSSMERIGGSVAIASESGKGTTVTLVFPLA